MIVATIVHDVRMVSVRCAPPAPVEIHMVSVSTGAGAPWEFSINRRVNTPLRRAIVCAHAIRYVREKTQ